MARLTRAQAQERNRARVLAAARAEFAERGYREAKIDGIADRAELTRGAVYSNFPGKRALYFAVLAELAETAEPPAPAQPALTVGEALREVARAWVTRLPLATDDERGPSRLGMHLMPEILADEFTRVPYAQLVKLDAILLGLALERLSPPRAPDGRLVRLAETALTVLHGAGQLAAAAPGFVEPFNVVRACERLAGLDLGDRWFVAPLRPRVSAGDEPWSPPSPVPDAVSGERVPLTGDGVVAVLGMHRLSSVEDAVRAAPPGAEVTAVVVSGAPEELFPLARLTLAELCGCLRPAVPRAAWPRLRVVWDESGDLAAAAGVTAPDDATEVALRVEAGRVRLRAEGYGAAHAAARHPA
ncbi:HTH-type transcriptional regulator SrpR [Nonomuraea coxensis DSM 45129]|uniref:HTH-type transcriptional regulator SrpR n=1 Tax=Nonomuraea coxensis DSM 45129 TaxID=1122611 RepID=A0ABX8U695_9ACTN|nr:TetR/AcrR family transcriptional regulator [Nonomuraea coxensis]QYC42639.1 HTH-type transcriptional regulator SrpR [Nonomuraea coxensis DSM 45129]